MIEFRSAKRTLCFAFFTLLSHHIARCSPPEDPVFCTAPGERNNCTITNAFGAFPDRAICHAAKLFYVTGEVEIRNLVATAVQAKKKMKIAASSHSIPKLVCPDGDDSFIISMRFLTAVVSYDVPGLLMTVESGISLENFIDAAAEHGLALPYAPYWWGVTMGGILGTGAHGSSLWGKGSAVHDYVVGVRIVTPASAKEGYAKVRVLNATHPDLDAVKVNLGVLGVITEITFKMQPLFKRSVTYQSRNDADLGDKAASFGNEHEFADMTWLPAEREVVYRIDDRVGSDHVGDGHLDFTGFRSLPSQVSAVTRLAEENQETRSDTNGTCVAAKQVTDAFVADGYGLRKNNSDILFTGYPVVGFQNRMQSSGSCLNSPRDALATACTWDPRINGAFYFNTAISIGRSKVKDFILDFQKLRDLEPEALCGVDLYNGILMRYVKASSAYLGKQEDGLDLDIIYYRSHDPMTPRLHEDVLEEIEQMALFKYGGLPHWGKNRNIAFDGVIDKYSKRKEFLRVKKAYDPDGLFSNEWTDQILGIKGRPIIMKEGCALEGLCRCRKDIHCAPDKGYFCRPGKVYKPARVCRRMATK